jgi:hypothetical protein
VSADECERIKRNVPRNVRRGISDMFCGSVVRAMMQFSADEWLLIHILLTESWKWRCSHGSCPVRGAQIFSP